jgi:hypothetical protein
MKLVTQNTKKTLFFSHGHLIDALLSKENLSSKARVRTKGQLVGLWFSRGLGLRAFKRTKPTQWRGSLAVLFDNLSS